MLPPVRKACGSFCTIVALTLVEPTPSGTFAPAYA
jgi:hypothetical protein